MEAKGPDPISQKISSEKSHQKIPGEAKSTLPKRRLRPSARGRQATAPQFVHSFCNGLEGMEFEPMWLVFLLLMVGVAASARWILLLRGFSGEISR